MPKISEMKTRKKRAYTTKHSPAILELAVEAIKKKKMSSYAAEKAFGIPRRTLLDKLQNKHPKSPGRPTRLTDEEEADIIKVLIASAEYGSPLTLLDLRVVVHRYLANNGRLSIFNNKLPGKKWAYSLVKRNKSKLTYRVIQNIKRSRAEKTVVEMEEYFKNLQSSLKDVPNENILNYDETNLTDNPGAQKCLFKRGVKYPERVLNYTKGAISLMFAITAGGECLPPYVVYKAEHLYTQWTLNGPLGSRFNRSKSGWFDSLLFEDWFESIILPWAKKKTGTKVLIGDNLASHINYKIVTYCEENNIRFVFLPPNSSHLTQPLDVCYYGPLKKLWREILLNYKVKNPREATIHKGHFPDLLKILMNQLNEKSHNIISAFRSTGIVPFNPDKVISKLPDSKQSKMPYSIDIALLDWLKETRTADPNKKVRSKKINVPPGKSVCAGDFEDLSNQVKKNKKKVKTAKNTKRMDNMEQSGSLLQSKSLLNPKSPESLVNLCIRSVNAYFIQFEQIPEASSSEMLKVLSLDKISKSDQANMPFINEVPECLQPTNKTKITITSDVIVQAGTSRRIQQKNPVNTNFKMKGVSKITRSALHMQLLPIKKEKVAKRKVLEEIAQKTKGNFTDTIDKKQNNETRKRKIKSRETNKSKKKGHKQKSIKQKKKRPVSESSSATDVDMSISDTDDSEYETIDEFITLCQQEEQENLEPIPCGISDIENFTANCNKLNTDSWILAKFVTKKSIKYYVGKVISMKDNVPEVKFVRKVKESKCDRGLMFTYPTIDDICTMKHLDDIVMVLPEPNICRRGQIIFNINLSRYNVQ
ncbi:hypothetical protein evm_008280 [Chilo suppressalis]|nr:hypothetical protein evm_008280 [Chilo suppressalis]